KINLFILFLILISFQSNAQLLDSIALSKQIEYTSLEEALKNPDKVYKLNLKKKKYKTIPKEVFTFTNLQVLILTKNKITEVPKEIGKLKNLEKLDLSSNKLSGLPAEIGLLINLKDLIINQNMIESLPKEIGNLKNLRFLDMWSNELYRFPDEITLLKDNLKRVDLRVIRMSFKAQDKISEQLPNTTILFSKGCNCDD
ncbi:leucine-rich repeat domain-containing protein, partial [Bacteroidota bacterium]